MGLRQHKTNPPEPSNGHSGAQNPQGRGVHQVDSSCSPDRQSGAGLCPLAGSFYSPLGRSPTCAAESLAGGNLHPIRPPRHRFVVRKRRNCGWLWNWLGTTHQPSKGGIPEAGCWRLSRWMSPSGRHDLSSGHNRFPGPERQKLIWRFQDNALAGEEIWPTRWMHGMNSSHSRRYVLAPGAG